MLYLFNTLTGKKEVFKSLEDERAGMYNCGPTVYSPPHIGNLRSYVFADILRRALEQNGYAVRQIINITDVGHLTSDADTGEDKMAEALKREGKPLTREAMKELGRHYADVFEQNLEKLNTERPTSLPFASEHIPEQIDIIKILEEKGFTYTTRDGVYFDTSKDPNYGKLRAPQEDTRERVEHDSKKRNPRDFALWKFSGELGWESPWGKGFPGWHLECSAMSMKYLGEHFDIHTGGVDHIGTHHNNEIAQSENVTDEPLANYWLHNEHLLVDGKKMSKSLGNVFTLDDIEEKGVDALTLRYFFLGAHYRSIQNFTWEALEGASQALQRLKNRALTLLPHRDSAKDSGAAFERFMGRINDDLDTPGALAVLWDTLGDSSLSDEEKAVIFVYDRVLGLGLAELEMPEIPEEVKELAKKREELRAQEKWDEADEVREEIRTHGFDISDTEDGTHILPI